MPIVAQQDDDDNNNVQLGYTVVIAALVFYIAVSQAMSTRRRQRQFAEGFENLNDSLRFMLSNADGAISTCSTSDLGTQIINQVQASANNTYTTAVNSTTAAVGLLSARIDAANGVAKQVANQIKALNAVTVRNDKTYQIHSMNPQYANCLDGNGNQQQCNWDNEYRRFVFQQTPYAPGIPTHH